MTIDWIPPGLEPVIFRVARADSCAYAITEDIATWSSGQPIELEEVTKAGDAYDVVVSWVRPVAPEVALLFSEAIHHLRAALDNVIWHLVEQAQGALTASQTREVALPIYDDETAFDHWVSRRVRNGLRAFAGTQTLGQRVRSLQPFADPTETVESIGGVLAALSGMDRELAHPLKLLQEYSNEDKHRQIRVAAARTIATTFDRPYFEQDRRQQPVQVGMVIASGVWGTPLIVETSTAAVIRRPGTFDAWINPAKEIGALRRYVADVAIPILLTGLALPNVVPPAIDLSDNGLDDRARIAEGGNDDSEARFRPRLAELFKRANEAPPTFLAPSDAATREADS